MTQLPGQPGQPGRGEWQQQGGQPPSQPAQQGSWQQGGQQLPPPGYLHLTIQGSAMTSNLTAPNVVIDGYHVPSSYGSNTYPLVPGQHQVHVYAQWMRQYGQADIAVNIMEGQQAPVFYRAPLHQFTTGSIGFEKQKAKGKGCMVTFAVVMVLIILVPIILGVLASS
ncbi:hypothetical protein [Yimella sp. cx-51]|uniref:hypothetical protein n=1 Tax=Yimella sp. cx-51 TaxID=2770551 RepID=UPI00165EBD3F|nr:hypothetical protein [Yimella sp. cx-51]MBC9956912.1 hypothetical protein [Yimella sp. cx-51]QTH39132.1 hypothetical protein J5M86_05815 [Yimella sp. cx-51]